MSGRVVSRVLESALPADVKFTAAVFASFADEDGRCWPSIGQVAHLRGLQERAVQYHVKELRRMEIFHVEREATQWHPAHYRIVLEKLPGRAPYTPPDRQLWLGPPGESPPVENPGVQPTAPQPGVQPSVPGVQPVAPDPSVRSVSTHTYSRARELGVQPVAPLTDPRAGESALPLIVAPRRDPDHAAHAWCGRICVPKFLHKQFKKAVGGPLQYRAKHLRAFYAETIAAIPRATPIGDEPVKFWRRAFAVRFSGAADTTRLSRRDLEDAAAYRAHVSNGCPHDPRCTDYAACVRDIALARKVG